ETLRVVIYCPCATAIRAFLLHRTPSAWERRVCVFCQKTEFWCSVRQVVSGAVKIVHAVRCGRNLKSPSSPEIPVISACQIARHSIAFSVDNATDATTIRKRSDAKGTSFVNLSASIRLLIESIHIF